MAKPKSYYFDDGRPDRRDPAKFAMTRAKNGKACFHHMDLVRGKMRCLKCGTQMGPAKRVFVKPEH